MHWVLDGAHEAKPASTPAPATPKPKFEFKHEQGSDVDGTDSDDGDQDLDNLSARWVQTLRMPKFKKDDAIARNILRQSVHQRLENAMVHMRSAKQMWLEPAVQMQPSDFMHRVKEEIDVHNYGDPMQLCDAMQEFITVARMNPTVGDLRWAKQLLMGAAVSSCPIDRYWGFELVWKTIPQEQQTVELFAQHFQYFLNQ